MMKSNDLVFCSGPAGTGKTFLAMAAAVKALQTRQVDRIVLTRPAVEAGERLGFLPGTLVEKVNPYLRPLFDALYELIGAEPTAKLLGSDELEIAPLAFMRGRTLGRAFVILDESQNTTVEQMRMFLTRIGRGSKVVVTGDPTQTDLPSSQRSGFHHAVGLLTGVDGIGMVKLDAVDVVRHRLVRDIIQAYEHDGAQG
jgi:phosphate starvation-inducible PhoH-like protein